MARVNLCRQTGVAATVTLKSVFTDVLGNFAASLKVANADRTTGDETYDAKIQDSPHGLDVADADATWHDLVTFTQVAATSGSEKKTVTDPHYSRMRLVLTLGGTTPSADFEVDIEGLRVS